MGAFVWEGAATLSSPHISLPPTTARDRQMARQTCERQSSREYDGHWSFVYYRRPDESAIRGNAKKQKSKPKTTTKTKAPQFFIFISVSSLWCQNWLDSKKISSIATFYKEQRDSQGICQVGLWKKRGINKFIYIINYKLVLCATHSWASYIISLIFTKGGYPLFRDKGSAFRKAA